MFATSGYFRGVPCPYYASGLCERPYCHFRHVKFDEKGPESGGISRSQSVPDDSTRQRPTLLSMVGTAIAQVQRDIEQDKARLYGSSPTIEVCNGMRPGLPCVAPVYQPSAVAAKTPNATPKSPVSSPLYAKRVTIPEYKPTPIKELKAAKKSCGYSTEPSRVSDLEYDPTTNFSTNGRVGHKRTKAMPDVVSKKRKVGEETDPESTVDILDEKCEITPEPCGISDKQASVLKTEDKLSDEKKSPIAKSIQSDKAEGSEKSIDDVTEAHESKISQNDCEKTDASLDVPEKRTVADTSPPAINARNIPGSVDKKDRNIWDLIPGPLDTKPTASEATGKDDSKQESNFKKKGDDGKKQKSKDGSKSEKHKKERETSKSKKHKKDKDRSVSEKHAKDGDSSKSERHKRDGSKVIDGDKSSKNVDGDAGLSLNKKQHRHSSGDSTHSKTHKKDRCVLAEEKHKSDKSSKSSQSHQKDDKSDEQKHSHNKDIVSNSQSCERQSPSSHSERKMPAEDENCSKVDDQEHPVTVPDHRERSSSSELSVRHDASHYEVKKSDNGEKCSSSGKKSRSPVKSSCPRDRSSSSEFADRHCSPHHKSLLSDTDKKYSKSESKGSLLSKKHRSSSIEDNVKIDTPERVNTDSFVRKKHSSKKAKKHKRKRSKSPKHQKYRSSSLSSCDESSQRAKQSSPRRNGEESLLSERQSDSDFHPALNDERVDSSKQDVGICLESEEHNTVGSPAHRKHRISSSETSQKGHHSSRSKHKKSKRSKHEHKHKSPPGSSKKRKSSHHRDKESSHLDDHSTDEIFMEKIKTEGASGSATGLKSKDDSTSSRKRSLSASHPSHVDLFGSEDSDCEVVQVEDHVRSPSESEIVQLSSESDDDVANVSSFADDLQTMDEDHSNQALPTAKDSETSYQPAVTGKQRVAHASSSANARGHTSLLNRRPSASQRKIVRPSAAQVMHQRMEAMRKKALEAEQKVKVEDSNPFGKKERVAHAPSSRAVASSDDNSEKTRCGTIDKMKSQRIAHQPAKLTPTLKRPTVVPEVGSKVPTNVRNQYLNRIIDECLKIYPDEQDAFDRSLSEELAINKRCSSRTVYLNAVVLLIKRLRSETPFSSSDSDSSSNKKSLAHSYVLGGPRAATTSFSMNRSGRLPKELDFSSGTQFYVALSKYVMTNLQLLENGFPLPTEEEGVVVVKTPEGRTKVYSNKATERICCRCGLRFQVAPNGNYIGNETCTYHWGRAYKRRIAGQIEARYSCCQGDLGAKGCQVADNHVHEQNKKDDMSGYMRTRPCSPDRDCNYGVYALDCEMIYTVAGMELARVTVIGPDSSPVLEKLVRPTRQIVDYNTRFSGITAADMEGVTTSIFDVHNELDSLFNDKSILIGHSLESDFTALKLLHQTVVDTSVVFPHKLGPPYKRALRNLMSEILQKIIQQDEGGHDSLEDAVSCMELMIWKVKEDIRKKRRS